MNLPDEGFIDDVAVAQILLRFFESERLKANVRQQTGQFGPMLLQRVAPADDEEDRSGKVPVLTFEQVDQPGGKRPRRALEDIQHDNQRSLFGRFIEQADEEGGQDLLRLAHELHFVLVPPTGDRILRQFHQSVACGSLVQIIGKDPNPRGAAQALDGEVGDSPRDHADHPSRGQGVAFNLLARLEVFLVAIVEFLANNPYPRQLLGDCPHDFHREKMAVITRNDIGVDF